ncbi:citrulline utilization hydrolase CtlX [Alteromonas sp. HB246098]
MQASHITNTRLTTPNTVLMVRPCHFRPNEQTAKDNSFQKPFVLKRENIEEISKNACIEFDEMVRTLRINHMTVEVFETEDEKTPDSVFPNNWLSTHPNGLLVTYPMYCENRRNERRGDIISYLQKHYDVAQTTDLSYLEKDNLIVEGTGAMVIDHKSKLAYVCLSQRANKKAVTAACKLIGLTPVFFSAFDANGTAVYHTNVMMSVGSDFAIVATSMIKDCDRPLVLSTLKESGKTVIEINEAQVNAFAGNCLELLNNSGKRLLLLSQTAFNSLDETQRALLPTDLTLLPIAVPTIEMGGGSVRCMVAGIHLQRKVVDSKVNETSRPSPQTRIRLVKEGDLEGLLALAQAASPGMTTFPPDRLTLNSKLKRSIIEEQKLYKKERPDYLLFVLEELHSGELVGTSAIFGELGKDDSFYSYKREKVTQRNNALGVQYTHDVLHLSHHFEGYAEVASLFLLPQYRKDFNGKLLTKVRYLFMGLHQSVFPKNVMADLRGYVDEEGRSPFWNALGNHFFPMTYAEADLYGAVNGNQFIADLMPKLPLYVNMLPDDAQHAIGKPHNDGRPAMALLEKEGFKFTNYIDIFDGAPSMEAEVAALKTVQTTKQIKVEIAHSVTKGRLMLVATRNQPFYAMMAEVNEQGEIAVISQRTAQALNLSSGNTILLSEV